MTLPFCLWWLAILPGTPSFAAPTAGSGMKPDEVSCGMCHGEAALWEGERARLHIDPALLKDDVHQQVGVNCHDCHGGDPASFDVPDAHAPSKGFRELSEIRQSCLTCHREQAIDVERRSVHSRAGPKNARGRGTPLACSACHGKKVHGMVAADDPRSPVHLENQVETCGQCHERLRASYEQTVHGQALTGAGLISTAVCADCHGAHAVYHAADKRSTLFRSTVAATCGRCHALLQDRVEHSVHGRLLAEDVEPRTAPGGETTRPASCTDCHQGHHIIRPEEATFRLELPNRCGNCHLELFQRYRMSTHGMQREHGVAAAAECSDCHGSHRITPVEDPASPLAQPRRVEVCRQCHVNATPSFAQYDPHANSSDPDRYPGLHAVATGTLRFLLAALALFVVHLVLWFARALIQVLRGGRKPVLRADSGLVFVRYRTIHRITYVMLLTSFLGMVLTAMSLKFGELHWCQRVVQFLGGINNTLVWHQVFAVLALFALILHVGWGIGAIVRACRTATSWRELLFGPDSPLPRWRDAKDLYGMFRWFVGLGPKPTFERWTYWEKVDYWALGLAAAVVGFSGLLLWYPNLSSYLFGGRSLNYAQLLHTELSFSIAGIVFLIHLFNTHFRPEKFPLDPSVFTGLVNEEHLRRARPEYVERIERSGLAEEVIRRAPSRKRLVTVTVVAWIALFVGLGLLAAVLLAWLEK